MMRIILCSIGLLSALIVASAQSFTYQGFLKEGGNPASGTFNMTFRLFDVPTGGTALATIGPASVSVSNGLFTVELNYPASVWTGANRWLEIQVGSTTLSPRVKITRTPYAIYSANTRGLNVDTNLNVGLTNIRRFIGLNPSDSFSYDGKAMGHYAVGWFDDSWNGAGATAWLSGYAGIKLFTNGTPRLAITNVGDVGIGTLSPSFRLHVETNTGQRAIFGNHTATTGEAYGVFGQSASTDGRGVLGWATATTGTTYGVIGQSVSTAGRGVYGEALANTGTTYGVIGQSFSTAGRGVAGLASATTGTTYGVIGQSFSTDGRGVYGEATASTGSAYGVLGISNSTTGVGVFGLTPATIGTNIGVYGESYSTAGRGMVGVASATTGAAYGVMGISVSTAGVGVVGLTPALTGTTYGVYGESASTDGMGVVGVASISTGLAYGVLGISDSTEGKGVYGWATATAGTTVGVYGRTDSPSGYGVFSLGRFAALGTKSFQMDHPLRPETHYLNHFCTEAPEPLNAYSGNVVTDAQGYATVRLPDYFETINRDFRYQLTVIDGAGEEFVQVRVVRKIQNNQFVIRTSKPHVEVSWRVEAIRNDRWVQEYGYQTEQEKPKEHQGKYLHPELYGQPKEKGIHYHPEPERPKTEPARPNQQ